MTATTPEPTWCEFPLADLHPDAPAYLTDQLRSRGLTAYLQDRTLVVEATRAGPAAELIRSVRGVTPTSSPAAAPDFGTSGVRTGKALAFTAIGLVAVSVLFLIGPFTSIPAIGVGALARATADSDDATRRTARMAMRLGWAVTIISILGVIAATIGFSVLAQNVHR